MSEQNGQNHDMDIIIGVNADDVAQSLDAITKKLDTFSKGVQSSLNFNIDTSAVDKAHRSLKELTGVSFDALEEDLIQLGIQLNLLKSFDPSKIKDISDFNTTPIVQATEHLDKLKQKLVSVKDISSMDSLSIKGLSSAELEGASAQLTTYQAALDGISTNLREMATAATGSFGQQSQQAKNYTNMLELLEDEMSQVDDKMSLIQQHMSSLGNVQMGSTDVNQMEDALEQVAATAKRASDQIAQVAQKISGAFNYESESDMITRARQLLEYSENARDVIAAQQKLYREVRQTTSDLSLQEAAFDSAANKIAHAQGKLAEYGKELEFIRNKLNEVGKGQEVFGNTPQLPAPANLPVPSSLGVPQVREMEQAMQGVTTRVHEMTREYQTAVSSASSLNERVALTQDLVRNVSRNYRETFDISRLVSRAAAAMNRELERSSNIIKGIVFAQVFYQITGAIKEAAMELVKFRMDIEETTTAFGLMLDSTEKGEQLSKELMDFAAKTPLNYQQVSQGVRMLQAYGFEAENLLSVMGHITDAAAAAGDPQKFHQIALALGQINAKGKLAGQEINQLAEAGVNAKKYIKEGLNLTTEELNKLQKAGIPSQVAIKAILDGIEKQYGGAAQKIAETLRGLASTVKDNFMIIGQSFLDPFFASAKGMMLGLRKVTDEWRQIVYDTGFGGLLEHLFPKELVDQVRILMANLAILRGAFVDIVTASGPFIQALFQAGVLILNSLLPPITIFLNLLAKLVNIVSQNAFAMRILTAALIGLIVVKTVTSFLLNFWKIMDLVGGGLSIATQMTFGFGRVLLSTLNPIKAFTAACTVAKLATGNWIGAIATVLGFLAALVAMSKKSSDMMNKLMGSTANMMGVDYTKIWEKSTKDAKDQTGQFNKELDVTKENLQQLKDASTKAGKAIKTGFLASFDEVHTIPNPMSNMDLGLDGLIDSLDKIPEKAKKAGDALKKHIRDPLKEPIVIPFIFKIPKLPQFDFAFKPILIPITFPSFAAISEKLRELLRQLGKIPRSISIGIGVATGAASAAIQALLEQLGRIPSSVSIGVAVAAGAASTALSGLYSSIMKIPSACNINVSAVGATAAATALGGLATLIHNTLIPGFFLLPSTIRSLVLPGFDLLGQSIRNNLIPGLVQLPQTIRSLVLPGFDLMNKTLREMLLPGIELVSKTIHDLLLPGFQLIPQAITAMAVAIPIALQGILPQMVTVATQLVAPVVSTFTALPGVVAAFVGQIPGVIVSSVAGALSAAAQVCAAILQPFATLGANVLSVVATGFAQVITFFVELPGRVVQALNPLSEGVQNAFSSIWEGVQTSCENFMTWMEGKWGWLGGILLAIVVGIGITLFGGWAAIGAGIMAIVEPLVAGVVGSFSGLATGVLTFVSTMGFGITRSFADSKDSTAKSTASMKSDTTSKFASMKQSVQTATQAIKSAVSTAWGQVQSKTASCWNAVRSLTSTIWNGIFGTIDRIMQNISNSVSRVIDSITRKFNGLQRMFNTVASKVGSIFGGGGGGGGSFFGGGGSSFGGGDLMTSSTAAPSPMMGSFATPLAYSAPTLPNIGYVKAPSTPNYSNYKASTTSTPSASDIGKEVAAHMLPALTNHPGTQKTGPAIQVGTLIADDRGLRELDRRMRSIQQQENDRRG